MLYIDLESIATEDEMLEVTKKVVRRTIITNNSRKRNRFQRTKSNDSLLGSIEDICFAECWQKPIDYIDSVQSKMDQASVQDKAKSYNLKPSS
tara:strand:+ start:219 stop:497 length:279 start_codon:yes stop_codon:yes gene_type:complete